MQAPTFPSTYLRTPEAMAADARWLQASDRAVSQPVASIPQVLDTWHSALATALQNAATSGYGSASLFGEQASKADVAATRPPTAKINRKRMAGSLAAAGRGAEFSALRPRPSPRPRAPPGQRVPRRRAAAGAH